MKSQHVCVKIAILLDGKLYVKTFSLLYVYYIMVMLYLSVKKLVK